MLPSHSYTKCLAILSLVPPSNPLACERFYAISMWGPGQAPSLPCLNELTECYRVYLGRGSDINKGKPEFELGSSPYRFLKVF